MWRTEAFSNLPLRPLCDMHARNIKNTIQAILFCLAIAASGVAVPLHAHVAKPTKAQRKAAGFWRVQEPHQTGSVQWVAIYVGDSPGTMSARWPTGLGCQYEPAEMHGNKITTVRPNVPAVIELNGSKNATLTLGESTILHLRKTSASTSFACE
jgi:hypothetical protein